MRLLMSAGNMDLHANISKPPHPDMKNVTETTVNECTHALAITHSP